MRRQTMKPAESARTLAELSEYRPGLHRYLARRIRRTSDVQDLMQEIFQRFLQLPHAERVRNPQAYLYTVASHLVMEFLRHEARSPVSYDSAAVDAAAQSENHTSDVDLAEQVGLQQEMLQALRQLPPTQRLVLLMVKREGCSYEEVAQKLGLELSTVTDYVCKARAKMKQLLKREPGNAQ